MLFVLVVVKICWLTRRTMRICGLFGVVPEWAIFARKGLEISTGGVVPKWGFSGGCTKRTKRTFRPLRRFGQGVRFVFGGEFFSEMAARLRLGRRDRCQGWAGWLATRRGDKTLALNLIKIVNV